MLLAHGELRALRELRALGILWELWAVRTMRELRHVRDLGTLWHLRRLGALRGLDGISFLCLSGSRGPEDALLTVCALVPVGEVGPPLHLLGLLGVPSLAVVTSLSCVPMILSMAQGGRVLSARVQAFIVGSVSTRLGRLLLLLLVGKSQGCKDWKR